MPSPIAILCSGPSIDDYQLGKISCETIGLNGSWQKIKSSYHVMADPEQWEYYQRITGNPPSKIVNLHTGRDGPEGAIHMDFLDTKEPRFSWYPFELGVYLCGTVTWVALQLAVCWRRNPIYFIGLDMGARGDQMKCKGALGRWAHGMEARQRELMGYAAGLLRPSGIELINVNDDSNCWAFPIRPFREVFP